MVSKNMVSIGVGIRRSFAEARSIERESRNWSTSLSLSSSTDKLDYIEESRTVFLTQIQKSRSNQISIKCTRISIEENRLLFRCSWNGSSWTMGSLETCKMKKEMRETWLDKQFSDQLSALSIRMEIRIRRPPCWFYFPRLFWLPPPVPSSAALIYFPRSFRLPYTSRDVLFAIPLAETLSSHRRVSSRFFFFFFPLRLIQLGQRNFYPPLARSPHPQDFEQAYLTSYAGYYNGFTALCPFT